MNIKKIVCITALASLAMTGTAFAGTWKGGEGENQNKWWYDNGNGSYPSNCWQWIDGNGDGTAESYYFDHNGWLLTDTTTPDGYTVNASGAWVQKMKETLDSLVDLLDGKGARQEDLLD